MGNEWILICFASCSVLAAGLVSAAALGEARGYAWKRNCLLACLSLVLIACGGAAAMVSLGHPQLVLGALHNPGSGIFWELLAASAAAVCCGGYLAASWFAWNETACKALVFAASGFAFILLAGIGKSFYMPWRDALNTMTLLLVFPGWGLAAAALCAAGFEAAEGQSRGGAELGALVLGIVLVAVYPAALLLGSAAAQDEIMHCISGEFAGVFWFATVGCGLLVPVALMLVGANRLWAAVTGLFFLAVGTASFQWLVIKIGTANWQFFQH